MNWLYLRGVYHNSTNINKIKFTEYGGVEIWFKEDPSPSLYFELTSSERKVLNKLLNNDNTTDS